MIFDKESFMVGFLVGRIPWPSIPTSSRDYITMENDESSDENMDNVGNNDNLITYGVEP